MGSPQSVSGLIERVSFHNEENGFAVLRVKVKGRRDLVTVVGKLPSVSAGEWLTAEGAWVQDREFGLQLQAHLLKSAPPSTREGIEKYLGSGMIKGIGPVYAKKLVNQFGEGVFDIIDHTSARLEEVEGIGPGRRRRIKAAWAEQKVIRKIMVFLHSHGVSTSRAVRIYKTYGEEAIETVQTNPYALARDIPGIGFKSADQIAQRIGIATDSLVRARAGLRHLLQESTNKGHCALPDTLLRREGAALLETDVSLVERALTEALAESEFHRETINDETLIFLPALKLAEETVARVIKRLAREPVNYPPIDLEKALAWWQKKAGRELANSQQHALRQALTARAVIITGGPGVGKTTLTNAILAILCAKQVRCLLAAPTGRAAKRMTEATGLPAQTIHRLLEVDPAKGGFVRNEHNPLKCDLVLLDECSMIDVRLMASLLNALPRDASLILVGDADQLPSVGPGAVLQDLIASRLLPVVHLTEVFRQAANSQIVTAAHAINEGRLPPLDGGRDSDFHFLEREDPAAISRTLVKSVQRARKKTQGDVQVLSPMNRGALGVRQLNQTLQETLNPARPGEVPVEKFGWKFGLRDKVLQTSNNYDKEVFNGDIGTVIRIDPWEHEVTVRFDQREVIYDYGELDELSLAYATTIHKAQGSEYPAVIIPLSTQHYMMLQRNLLYTAVTRGRQLVVVVGERKALEMAVRNNVTRRRYSGLLHRLQNG